MPSHEPRHPRFLKQSWTRRSAKAFSNSSHSTLPLWSVSAFANLVSKEGLSRKSVARSFPTHCHVSKTLVISTASFFRCGMETAPSRKLRMCDGCVAHSGVSSWVATAAVAVAAVVVSLLTVGLCSHLCSLLAKTLARSRSPLSILGQSD